MLPVLQAIGARWPLIPGNIITALRATFALMAPLHEHRFLASRVRTEYRRELQASLIVVFAILHVIALLEAV